MAVVGIDLGTTNTVVACVRNGRVHVLPDEKGRRLLPSVVSFHPNGEILVGYPAKERRILDARNTIASVKRLIGRAWESDEIKRARQRFAFELKEGPGQGPLVVARGQEYTLPEISAFVLRRAKEIAERALGEAVDRAVITVPANFNELQRAATKVAGKVAGLDVLRIINEPTAAALAYGLGRAAKERICIYDFGGGTFDCTLLDLSGNVFEVLATAGDTFLGGDDLDMAISERMAQSFLHTHRYDPRTDAQSFERLRVTAEQVKIELSTHDRATTRMSEVAFGVGGAPLDLDFSMTRDELEMLAAPLVERTFAVCQEALGVARLPVTSFDKVILVGGSTRIPLVRRRVEQFFGSMPLDKVNPDEVVAIGAAIQAAALTEVARRRSIPPAPVPAARRSYPSRPPPSERATTEDSVTLASPLTALSGASQDKPPSTLRGAAAAPQQPSKATMRMHGAAPPLPFAHAIVPAPAPASPPAGGAPAIPETHDPAATLPRPVAFEEVLRAERASRHPVDEPPRDLFAPAMSPSPAGPPVVPRTPPPPPPPAPPPAPPLPPAPAAAPPRTPAPPAPPRAPAQPSPPRTPAPPPPRASAPAFARAPASAPAPAPASVRAPASAPPPALYAPAPVLVDVTPRALVVETAGGWCDTVVQRNAKIPCERTRAFATSSDRQTVVRVRVAQGEDPVFGANTYLGEVELSGLRAAPRGEVTIRVRFEVDESGTLQVFAADASTGREAHATLQLVGIAGAQSIQAMQARQAGLRFGG